LVYVCKDTFPKVRMKIFKVIIYGSRRIDQGKSGGQIPRSRASRAYDPPIFEEGFQKGGDK